MLNYYKNCPVLVRSLVSPSRGRNTNIKHHWNDTTSAHNQLMLPKEALASPSPKSKLLKPRSRRKCHQEETKHNNRGPKWRRVDLALGKRNRTIFHKHRT